ncbi:MAG TPA: CoA-binding protein [Blastocatellia bacterium]|nr:CoA-binding protein [Blastocatellia bacterium]
MPEVPPQVAGFLSNRSIAVAGVSRDPAQPANLIYRKLKDSGHRVFPINPNATQVEGDSSYPDLRSVPEPVEAVVIATHPDVSVQVVRDCAELGINQVWFHRSFGEGSVSEEAVRECELRGIDCIVGGCPMMYCAPVDFAHRCMRWILKLQNRVPR